MLGAAGSNLLVRLRVGTECGDVTSLSTLETTALLDSLLAFSRVLRSVARATRSVNLHLYRVTCSLGADGRAARWEVPEIVVVSLDQVGVFIESAGDLNTSHLLANIVRQGATKLADLCSFVETGIGDDLAKVGEVGSEVLLSLFQVVETTPGSEFLVRISVGGLKKLDKGINRANA